MYSSHHRATHLLKRGQSCATLICWLLLAAVSARADDYDYLRLKWRDFLTGGTNLNLSDPSIANKVSYIGSSANSYWSSMIKTNNRTCLWSDTADTNASDVSANLNTTYNRLDSMAQGWATVGSSVYSNATLAADIVSALDWMYTNRYNEHMSIYGNGWEWIVGGPLALDETMLLMYDFLSPTQITNYCNAIDHFVPYPGQGGMNTGANRVWTSQVVCLSRRCRAQCRQGRLRP